MCVCDAERQLLLPEVNARGGWSLSEYHSFLLVPSFGRCLLSFACRLTKNGSMYTHAHTHAHARGALSACFTERGSAIVKKQWGFCFSTLHFLLTRRLLCIMRSKRSNMYSIVLSSFFFIFFYLSCNKAYVLSFFSRFFFVPP